jgi:hypothetical protein
MGILIRALARGTTWVLSGVEWECLKREFILPVGRSGLTNRKWRCRGKKGPSTYRTVKREGDDEAGVEVSVVVGDWAFLMR